MKIGEEKNLCEFLGMMMVSSERGKEICLVSFMYIFLYESVTFLLIFLNVVLFVRVGSPSALNNDYIYN